MPMVDPLELDLPDPEATAALGAAIARKLKAGEAVLLRGELGAGKSSLARGLIRALSSETEDVPSPTFTLVQFYETEPPIAHFDLYRLEGGAEAHEAGLEEALDTGAVVVEWPDQLSGAEWARLAPDRLVIDLWHDGEGRRARVASHGAWRERSLHDGS